MVLQFKNLEMLWLVPPLVAFCLFLLWRYWVLGWGKRTRLLLSLMGLCLCLIALARPQGGKMETTQTTRQSNLFIALDISKSMWVADVTPNRLQFAQGFLTKLFSEIGDFRVALFPFTDDGYPLLPLTSDKIAAQEMLATLSPSYRSNSGTDLSTSLRSLFEVIARTKTRTENASRDWAGAQVLLVSDGESHEKFDRAILSHFKKASIAIHTLAVGHPNGGPVPMDDRPVSSQPLMRDSTGRLVISKPNFALLQDISKTTNGGYFEADLNLVSVLAAQLTKFARFGNFSRTFVPQLELYPFLFLVALIVFFAETLLSRWEYALRVWWLVILLPLCAHADPDERTYYNEGLKFLQQQSLEEAARSFLDSATSARRSSIKKKAYFALGNTYLRMGDVAQALQAYQQAYDTVAEDRELEEEANQRISENMALAAELQQQAQKGGQSDTPSKDGSGDSQDPKKPQQFQNQQLSDEQKKKVFDLALSEEQQTLQRLRDQKRGKGQSLPSKPW